MSSCTCVVAPPLGGVSRPPDEAHVRGSLRRCCSARAADCNTFGEYVVFTTTASIWEPPGAAGAAPTWMSACVILMVFSPLERILERVLEGIVVGLERILERRLERSREDM